MAAKRPHNPRRGPGRPDRQSKTALGARRVEQNAWELVHPGCAQQRVDDLDEVQHMIDAGEFDIATDELRWLLADCPEFLAAHRLLGELALEQADWKLARAHFGIAFQLGLKAAQGIEGMFPYRLAANQSLHEAGKGLVWCLLRVGRRDLAQQAAEQLVRLDPLDPLNVRGLLAEADELDGGTTPDDAGHGGPAGDEEGHGGPAGHEEGPGGAARHDAQEGRPAP